MDKTFGGFFIAGDYSSDAIDNVMPTMYDQWLADLDDLTTTGGPVYFPVSFHDEGTPWVAML